MADPSQQEVDLVEAEIAKALEALDFQHMTGISEELWGLHNEDRSATFLVVLQKLAKRICIGVVIYKTYNPIWAPVLPLELASLDVVKAHFVSWKLTGDVCERHNNDF